jgi:O-antigen/teichoic acid export membrane protein
MSSRVGAVPAPVRALLDRTRRDSLVRNSLNIMGTTGVNLLLGYVFWVVAARTYTAHDFGLAGALISAMTLAFTVSSLGVGNALVQQLSRRDSGHDWSLTLNAGLTAGGLLSLVAGLSIVVVLPLLSSEYGILHDGLVYPLAFLAGVTTWILSDLLDKTFVAERATGNMLIRNTVFSLIKIPLVVLPTFVAAHAFGIVASWVVATTVTLVLSIALVRRLGRNYRPALDGVWGEMRRLQRTVAGHHLVSVGNMAPTFLLPMVVAGVLTPTENGYFYATWRVGGGFFIISAAVALSLFAEGSHAAEHLSQAVRKSAIFISALLAPAMAACLLAGHQILGLFGPTYADEGYPLLVVLVVSAVPDAITNVYVIVLRVQHRLRFAAGLTLGMATITLVGTIALAGPLGITGAGIAWFAAQSVGSTVVGLDVLRRRRRTGSALAVKAT